MLRSRIELLRLQDEQEVIKQKLNAGLKPQPFALIFNKFKTLLLAIILGGCSSPIILDNDTLYVGFNNYKKKTICEHVEYTDIQSLGTHIGRNSGIGYIDKKEIRIDFNNIKKPIICKTPIVDFYLGE